MKTTAFIMNFVMLAIFATMVGIASGYPAQARFMPFVVGIPAIALCLLQIVLDLRNMRREAARARNPDSQAATATRAAGEIPMDEGIPPNMVRKEITLWIYFLCLIGGILFFGFWLTIPIFLALFLRYQADLNWRKALLTAVIGTGILYLGVAKGLRYELHQGFLTTQILDSLRVDE